MVQKLKVDESINLYDNGEPIRDILHVKDACRAIELVCSESSFNQIYNIGSGKPTSVRDFIELARKKINSKSKIIPINSPSFHSQVQSRDFWMNTQKLRSLGFNAEYTIEDIVDEICNE